MLAYLNAFQSKYDSVLYYNKLVFDVASLHKDTFNIGVSFFNIGIAYRFMSELDSAVEYTLKGARILQGKGYTNIESTLNDGLQSLYMTLGQYDKAIQFGTKAVELARKLEDKAPLIFGLNNLGLSYTELGRYNEAKKIFSEAYQTATAVGNKSGQAMLLNNLSDIAIKENHFDLVKSYAEKSIQLNTELEDDGGLVGAKTALAAYYLSVNDFAKAEKLASEALKLSVNQNLLEGKPVALGMLSNIAFAAHDFKKGFDYATQKSKFENGVFTQSLQEKEATIRIRYETEKKDNQIKLQKAELDRRRAINFILIGSIAAAMLILILAYRTYRQKQKLQQKRISELETQQQLTATEAVLKGEEQERTRLAKDLHDGLGGMLSGIKYSFNNMKGNLVMTPENSKAFERSMDMLDSSIKEMRRVAHNMMPEALVKFGLDTALKDFCSEINQSGALAVNYQSFGLAGEMIDQTVSVTIYRIVQELINNTMKHAAAKTAIVQVTQSNALLTVTVEDDGKGFNPDILTHAKGIGWTNIQSRINFLKGKLDIDTQEGKGTSVLIELTI